MVDRGIDQVGGIQRGAAFLALVAVSTLIAAMRTGAGNIPVGQELLHLLIIILAGGLFNELTLVIQLAEESPRRSGNVFSMWCGNKC